MKKCTVCKVFMVEGYLNEESGDTFCNDAHLNSYYEEDVAAELSALDDEALEESTIYWTAWEDRVENVQAALKEIPNVDTEEEREALYSFISDNFKHTKNELNHPFPLQVYVIHDNIYFEKSFAELFEDGKEVVKEKFIIITAKETITEGTCEHPLFDSFDSALDEILAEEKMQ